MPHSFNKIWIHAIWATKFRQPFIHVSVENKIYSFVAEQLRELGCPVRIIKNIVCVIMPKSVNYTFNYKAN